MSKFKFHSTQTVEQFKASKGIKAISLLKVPKKDGSGSCVILSDKDSGESLGIMSPVTELKDMTMPVISDVTAEDGSRFFMLHQKGENQAEVITEL